MHQTQTIINMDSIFSTFGGFSGAGISSGISQITQSSSGRTNLGGINQGINQVIGSSAPSSIASQANPWVNFGFGWANGL